MSFKEKPITKKLPGSRFYEVRQVEEDKWMVFKREAPEGNHEGGRFFLDQYSAEYACECMDIAFSDGVDATKTEIAAFMRKLYSFNLKPTSS